MKANKILGVLLAVSMAGTMMTGCGNKAENVNTADTTEATTKMETETVGTTEKIVSTEIVDTTEIVEAGMEIIAGTYTGTYTKEAMGSEILYEYVLTLNEDHTYNYHVSFEMGGETYPEDEAGTYVTEENVIILTPETPWKETDASIMVTSPEAGKIQFSRCVSSFASAQTVLEAVITE